MPTYQYACPDCGYKFEQKQKFTDDAVKICPNCGRRHVYRVVGQVAISFKGSGWYITDSKSSSDKHTLEHKPRETGDGVKAGDTSGNGTEKGEKAEKGEKTEKSATPEKSEKAEKSDKPEKAEKSPARTETKSQT